MDAKSQKVFDTVKVFRAIKKKVAKEIEIITFEQFR
ncbi:hypothetical protein Barb4_02080 [Bacteroidales bacterium Barb4]|nr:hypothetical protein Barb4_02080 [Bacteroidales bacterium Barb4]